VKWNGPAAKAKITPGDKIIAVNGQIFSPDRFRAALHDAKNQTVPIHLTIQSDTFVSTVDLDYHDGERYPALERVEGTPAYLDDIIKPIAPSHETAQKPDANAH
jgi:predicted metalloprotease with PDZ domain